MPWSSTAPVRTISARGHNANGAFFLDPELIGGIDIVRGPSGNIYGSGAIGGVVSFRTKDIEDVVRPGERWGVDVGGMGGSNKTRGFASTFGGIRLNPDNRYVGGFVYRKTRTTRTAAAPRSATPIPKSPPGC